MTRLTTTCTTVRLLLASALVLSLLGSSVALAARPAKVKDDVWTKSFAAGRQALSTKAFRDAEREFLAAWEAIEPADAKDPRKKQTMEALVDIWMAEREWAAAEPWLQKIVKLDEAVRGPEHVEVSFSLSRLAQTQLMMSEFEKAEASYRRAIDIRVKATSPDDQGVAKLWHNLAETFRRAKRLDKAEALYRDALDMKTKALGPDHPSLASSLNDLGVVYNEQDQFSAALPHLQRAVKLATALGELSPVLGSAHHNLGDSLVGLKKYDEAEVAYKRALSIAEAQTPPDRPSMGRTLNNLANLYQYQGKLEDSLAAYDKSIEARKLEYGSKHSSVKQSRMNKAALLDRMGRTAEASAIRAEYGK